MPHKAPEFLTLRLTPADAAAVATIAAALRHATGDEFVSKAQAVRAALQVATTGKSLAEAAAR